MPFEPVGPAPQADLHGPRLRVLLEVARVINSSLDLEEVFARLLAEATAVLRAESGSLMLLDDTAATLRVVAACGPRAGAVRGRRQGVEEGVAGWVVRRRQPLLLHGEAADPALRRVCHRLDVRQAISVPLQDGDRVLGVLNLSNHQEGGRFDRDDVAFLTALASQAALAVRNAMAYAEATRQRRTVERLLEEVSRSQVAERARIAAELHDGPAQTLFAVLRTAELVRRRAASGTVPEEALLADLEETIRAAISDTRAVMIDLQPPALEAVPLSEALRKYVRQYAARTGIRTELQVQGEQRPLPASVESCLYRIAQEALANVWKHAGARQVGVLLESGHKRCLLEVQDDGCGFDPAEVAARSAEHLGLGLLRERAELAGGHLSVQAGPGHGTTVRVTVPLLEADEDPEDAEEGE